MAEECTHDCSTCQVDCESKKQDFRAYLNKNSKVKKVIGVVSGKGGVGKSFVTSYLSVLMKRRGFSVGILDADITGPSIPSAFNIHEKALGTDLGIMPAITSKGIQLISVNMMLEKEDTPVIWRGPVIAGVVKQFWSDVFWNNIDVMFVDMPPGTGDVPLTVFQSLPVDGIIVVTSPQELVSRRLKYSVRAMQKRLQRNSDLLFSENCLLILLFQKQLMQVPSKSLKAAGLMVQLTILRTRCSLMMTMKRSS